MYLLLILTLTNIGTPGMAYKADVLPVPSMHECERQQDKLDSVQLHDGVAVFTSCIDLPRYMAEHGA